MNGEVALIIIYNHQYTKNIDILEELYKDRFSNIYHLVPFYRGDNKRVIAVYENSYYFQGYIAQGFSTFFNEKYEHYFFIADDLILNPLISENNYREMLPLGANSSYISRLDSMHTFWKDRNIKLKRAFSFNVKLRGVEAENFLPSYQEALRLLNENKVEVGKLSIRQLFPGFNYKLTRLFAPLFERPRIFKFPYPVTSSYADICIVSSSAIRNFSHYCGVFAALDLWVEVALPTALAFATKDIVKDEDLNFAGKALWSEQDYQLLDKYDNNLGKLLRNFPENYLYLHPIKLSKWHVDTNLLTK